MSDESIKHPSIPESERLEAQGFEWMANWAAFGEFDDEEDMEHMATLDHLKKQFGEDNIVVGSPKLSEDQIRDINVNWHNRIPLIGLYIRKP